MMPPFCTSMFRRRVSVERNIADSFKWLDTK
jgi:hypothetical protein